MHDWHNYTDVAAKIKVDKLAAARVELGNDILSQGRVIITDRLHVSLLCLLMGRPHVILNEMYKKVENTRETAFAGKPECTQKNLLGFYVNSIEEAIDKAIWILEEKIF